MISCLIVQVQQHFILNNTEWSNDLLRFEPKSISPPKLLRSSRISFNVPKGSRNGPLYCIAVNDVNKIY